MSRKFPRTIKRIVIKIGSGVIEAHKKNPKGSDLSKLVKEMRRLHKEKTEIILVSSGAIILGMGELKLKTRPSDLVSLQACAAVGQNILMRTYSDLFKEISCAQILLTWHDFEDASRRNNAKHTLGKLLENRVIPIINENDTTSTEEIKFGDNDKLSAKVANLIRAELLEILSSGVKAVLDAQKNPILRTIEIIDEKIQSYARDTTNKNVSKGGMLTKFEAVKYATSHGIPCVIASSGTTNVITRVINVDPVAVGTYFTPVPMGTYPDVKEEKK